MEYALEGYGFSPSRVVRCALAAAGVEERDMAPPSAQSPAARKARESALRSASEREQERFFRRTEKNLTIRLKPE